MIDNKLMIKNLQKLERVFMIFSGYTKVPFVECDPETFDDQIHITATAEEAQEFAKAYVDKKMMMVAKEIPNAQMPIAFAQLYGFGVNAIVFHQNGTSARLQLEELVRKPDMEKLMADGLPRVNPTLNLSVMYFLQELCRPVDHDKELLKELEDEMTANLLRSNYILPMVPANQGEKLDPKNPQQKKVIAYIKNKEGQVFLPAFSDIMELQKFYQKKVSEIAMYVVPFKAFQKQMNDQVKGVLLNPAGYNLVIVKEQLKKIMTENGIE